MAERDEDPNLKWNTSMLVARDIEEFQHISFEICYENKVLLIMKSKLKFVL
jgi:hypothetical protein